jgi:hypothetical protein
MSTLFSIDNLIHAAIYLVLGFVLLIANVWFIRLVGNGLRGGELVIVPFQVIEQKDDDGKLASALAYMLQARLRKIGTDLEISQNILMEPPRSAVSRPDGTPTSIIPRIWASPVDIPVKLLDPVNIDVAVGGVQVGKVLPAIQRSIVKSRTLTFTVYYEGERAIITADIDAFQNTGGDALWIEVKKATPDEVVGSIAYELVQRKLANDPANKIEILNRDEFRTLLNILSEAAN